MDLLLRLSVLLLTVYKNFFLSIFSKVFDFAETFAEKQAHEANVDGSFFALVFV